MIVGGSKSKQTDLVVKDASSDGLKGYGTRAEIVFGAFISKSVVKENHS